MSDLFDLTGRVAIVTGGAGILGRGFCQVLAAHGAQVALVDVSEASAQEAADGLNATAGTGVFPVVCDVSDPQSVKSMVDAVVKRFGRIDILHNNAATKSRDLLAFFEPFPSWPN